MSDATIDAGAPPARRQPGRLGAWFALVGALAALAYVARLAEGKPANDVLFKWSTAVGGLLQYGLMLGLVLAIAGGLDRDLLALRLPARRGRAAALAGATFGGVLVVSGLLGLVLHAGDEQNLVPKHWDPAGAAPFVVNVAVVVLVAPFVEELLFRGLGYGLLVPFVGTWAAILIAGVAFGLAHGLLLGLPVLSLFGIALAWLRRETGSVVPGMVVHGCFNGLAILAAVLTWVT